MKRIAPALAALILLLASSLQGKAHAHGALPLPRPIHWALAAHPYGGPSLL